MQSYQRRPSPQQLYADGLPVARWMRDLWFSSDQKYCGLEDRAVDYIKINLLFYQGVKPHLVPEINILE